MLNHPAPDFTLTDLSGKQWQLSALKGKMVVLNFWFTNCIPCIAEMPGLNKLKESYAASDIVFLALALDEGEATRKFLQTHAFIYTQLPKAIDVSKAYRISVYPTSIIIDRQGVLRFECTGREFAAEKLKTAINNIDQS
jgi:peroxiredoxin